MSRARVLLVTLPLLLAACSSSQLSQGTDTGAQLTTPAPGGEFQTLSAVGMSGDLSFHDPSILGSVGFSTGNENTTSNPEGIRVHTTSGGVGGPWTTVGTIPVAAWAKSYNIKNVWAPDIVKNGSTFYLYYAASQFGTNNSGIGVATSTNPGNPNSWQDHGSAILTSNGTDYNAIDPDVFNDNGTYWMAFGSFFSGIKLVKMSSMTSITGTIYTLATRPGVQYNPLEAPSITKHNNYYYLFMAWDFCCKGTSSTYNTRVGRATSVTGPYYDQSGKRLDQGGGTLLLGNSGNQIGPGGADIIDGSSNLAYHYYDANDSGKWKLAVKTLSWVNDWPVP